MYARTNSRSALKPTQVTTSSQQPFRTKLQPPRLHDNKKTKENKENAEGKAILPLSLKPYLEDDETMPAKVDSRLGVAQN